jgi:hypothetical protein
MEAGSRPFATAARAAEAALWHNQSDRLREGVAMSDLQGSKSQHNGKADWGFVAFLIVIFVIAVRLR